MFKNLSIKMRLISTMALMAVLLVVCGVMGIIGLQKSNSAIKRVYETQMASSIAIGNFMTELLRARTALDRVVVRPDAPNAADTIKRAEGFHVVAEKEWNAYLSLPAGDEEKKLSDVVAAKRDLYMREGAIPFVEALKAGKKEEAEQIMMEKLAPLFSSMNASSDELTAYQMKVAAADYKENEVMYNTFRNATIGGIIFGVLIIATLGFFLMRAIMQPLQEALGHFDAISSGDLTTRIEPASKDEMGMLIAGLQKMQKSLIETVSSVRQSSGTMATATTQIAAGNMDLSSRTEEQASSLEETAASMEELTSTVKQNADNARQANQLVRSASDVAVKGGDVVAQVVHTMEDINQSSKKIVDIISVIDGIAFQTNILALNAAVEAARAGEQGRGFAVVASEVRSLAQRSASAAKEIKELIGNSVEKVDTGSKLVEQAGTTMQEIVESVRRVTDIMAEITAASAEQSAGIEQVNQAITQMDQVTQQNAALVEEAAAAAESLNDQASKLEQVVSVFKFDASSAPVTAAPMSKPKQPLALAKNAAARKPAAAHALPRQLAMKEAVAVGDWEEF